MARLVGSRVERTVAPGVLRRAFALAVVWVSTAGASITLFANLLTAPDMADWAWALVAPWQDWTPEFWDWFGVRAGLTLPNWFVPPLNFAVLLMLTAVGVGILGQENRERMVLKYPILQLLAGMVLMATIAYMLLAGQSQSSDAEDIPAATALVVLLAAAAVSFSPPIAGRGNLIKRLWFMLAGVGVLVGLNELSKLATRALGP
jgi:hypothetical protein